MESTNRDEFVYEIPPEDVIPIKNVCKWRLIQLLKDRNPEDLHKASILFRIWYRIQKSVYPPHDTWEEIARSLMEAEKSDE